MSHKTATQPNSNLTAGYILHSLPNSYVALPSGAVGGDTSLDAEHAVQHSWDAPDGGAIVLTAVYDTIGVLQDLGAGSVRINGHLFPANVPLRRDQYARLLDDLAEDPNGMRPVFGLRKHVALVHTADHTIASLTDPLAGSFVMAHGAHDEWSFDSLDAAQDWAHKFAVAEDGLGDTLYPLVESD